MMSANINLAVLQFVMFAFAAGSILGFAFRSKQIAKSKKRILELETEMVENHAEILKLHKIHSDKSGLSENVPVINLKVKEQLQASLKTKAKG
ncbi:hypothetical protein [Flavihumibacter profundi]|uniref:hypothetical protein n=1 Tax=Flavihumibacter profundi TaxID=2716883 RepID=UPI001CC3E3DE|nr:hypothetical protein [Flavihumibacter profundi]MBZ5858487.1 hypothetical protein [Flavihumibacter profundi]